MALYDQEGNPINEPVGQAPDQALEAPVQPTGLSDYENSLKDLVSMGERSKLSPDAMAVKREVNRPGVIPGGFKAGLYGGLAGAAKVVGADAASRTLQESAQDAAPDLDIRKVHGLRDAALYGAGLTSSAVGSMAPILAAGAVGTAIGGPVGGGLAAYGTAFPMEAGETLLNAQAEGMDTNDPEVRKAAYEKATINAALEAVFPVASMPLKGASAITRGAKALSRGRRTLGFAGKTALGAAAEGATEGAQELSGIYAMSRLTGNPVDLNDPDTRAQMVNAILGGALGGGVVGGAFHALETGAGVAADRARGRRGTATTDLFRNDDGTLSSKPSTDQLEAGEGLPGGEPPSGGPPPGGAAGAILAEPGVELEGEGRSVFDKFGKSVLGIEPQTGIRPGQAAPEGEFFRTEGVEQPTPQEVGQTVGQKARQVLNAAKVAAQDVAARISGGTMSKAEGSETLDAVMDASTDRSLGELVDASNAEIAASTLLNAGFTAQEPMVQGDLFTTNEGDVTESLTGGTPLVPASVPEGQEEQWLQQNAQEVLAQRVAQARHAYESLPVKERAIFGKEPDFTDEAVQRGIGAAYYVHSAKAKVSRLRGIIRKAGRRKAKMLTAAEATEFGLEGPVTPERAAEALAQRNGVFNKQFTQAEIILRSLVEQAIVNRQLQALMLRGQQGGAVTAEVAAVLKAARAKANEYAAAMRDVFLLSKDEENTNPTDELNALYNEMVADVGPQEAVKIFERAKGMYESRKDVKRMFRASEGTIGLVVNFIHKLGGNVTFSQARQIHSWLQSGLVGVGPGLERVRTALMSTFGANPAEFQNLIEAIDKQNQEMGIGAHEPRAFETDTESAQRANIEPEDEEQITANLVEEGTQMAEEAEPEQAVGFGTQESGFTPEIRIGSQRGLIPVSDTARLDNVAEGIRQGSLGDVKPRYFSIDEAIDRIMGEAAKGQYDLDPAEVQQWILGDLIASLYAMPSSPEIMTQLDELTALRESGRDATGALRKYAVFVLNPQERRVEQFTPVQHERIASAATQKGSAENGTIAVEQDWRGEPRRREYSAMQLILELFKSQGIGDARAYIASLEGQGIASDEALARTFSSGLGALMQAAKVTNLFKQTPQVEAVSGPEVPSAIQKLVRPTKTVMVEGKREQRAPVFGNLIAPKNQDQVLAWLEKIVPNPRKGKPGARRIPDASVAFDLDGARLILESSSWLLQLRNAETGEVIAGPQLRNDLVVFRSKSGREYTVGDLYKGMTRTTKESAERAAESKKQEAGFEEMLFEEPPQRAISETEVAEAPDMLGMAREALTATPIERERMAARPRRGVTKSERLLGMTSELVPRTERAQLIEIGSKDLNTLPSDVRDKIVNLVRPLYAKILQSRENVARVQAGEKPMFKGKPVTPESFAQAALMVDNPQTPSIKKAQAEVDKYYAAVKKAEATTGRPQQRVLPTGGVERQPEFEFEKMNRRTHAQKEALPRFVDETTGQPTTISDAELNRLRGRFMGMIERVRNVNKSSGAKRVFDRAVAAVNKGVLKPEEIVELGKSVVANVKNIPKLNAFMDDLSKTVVARQQARKAQPAKPQGRAGGAPTAVGKPQAAESASTQSLNQSIKKDIAGTLVGTIIVEPTRAASTDKILTDGGFVETSAGVYERRETPKSQQRLGLKRVPRETQEAIESEISKLLGPKVKTAWESGNFGASGEWIEEAGGWQGLIRLAMTAADALGVAHHEAMHALLSRLAGTEGGRRAIEKLVAATSTPEVIRQLRKALGDDPGALAQLSDPMERVTYAYQLYRANPKSFRLAPAARTWFERMVEFVRKVSGYLTDSQYAERLFDAFTEGSFASPPLMNDYLKNEIEALGTPDFRKWASKAPLMGGLKKMIYTGDGLLRSFNVPALSEIAELIQNKVGSGGFLPERIRAGEQWFNKLYDTIGGYTDEQLAKAHENLMLKKKPSSQLEKDLRQLLNDFYRYLEKAGVQQFVGMDQGKELWKLITFRKDFYPGVWKGENIAANREAFLTLLKKHGFEDAHANEIMEGIIAGDEAEDTVSGDFRNGYTPMFRSASVRQLDALYDDPDSLQFRNDNLVETLHKYMWQGVHRAEHTRHFGHRGEVVRAKIQAATAQGATREQIKSALDYIQAAEGTLGATISPNLRKATGAITVYQNIRLLPLALFSMFVDPMGLVVRGGTFREAGVAFAKGLKSAFVGLDQSEYTDIARLIGTISDRSALESLGQLYGSVHLTGMQRRINDTFFKLIGVTGWNNQMRASGTEAAIMWLRRQATNPDRHTVRALEELGLQPADLQLTPDKRRIKMFAEEGIDAASAKRIQQAVNRWVNEAIMRPTAADRPIWASNPYFALVFHLKQFAFSFQKYIMNRAFTEAKYGNYIPLLAVAGYVPIMMGADFARAILQGLGDEPEWRKKWTLGDRVSNAIQRAGVTGVPQFGLDSLEDARRGGLGFESFFGPTVGQASQAMQTLAGQRELGNFVLSSMPAMPVYKHWF